MALSMIWRDGHIDEPEAITATLCAMGADDDEEQDETTINDDGREVIVTNLI